MKKYIFLIFFIYINANMLFSQNSNLIFFDQEGNKFYVVLDGVKQNTESKANVKILYVNKSIYDVEIIFEDETIGEINKTIQFNPYTETVFAIMKNKKGEQLIKWQSEISIEQASQDAPNQAVLYFKDQLNTKDEKPSLTNSDTTKTLTNATQPDPNSNVNLDSIGIKTIPNIPSGNVKADIYLPGYEGNIGCPVPLNANDFARIKQSISSNSTDNAKLTKAKQLISSNCLLSSQVKEIMELINIEETRLELAKFAYGHTYDISNYYQLNDVFKSDTSIDELNEFILAH
jgi:hypothetical protein